MRKAPRAAFLAANPFPQPWTDGLFYREKMRAIHHVAPPRIGSDDGAQTRVLEVGGGRSGLAQRLYPQAAVVTLDRDPSQLGHVAPGRDICGDACRLPFADATFDCVTLFDVLEHVEDDALAAREAQRVTRPGGWLLVSTPNADWHYPSQRWMQRWCPPETALMREWGHVRRGYTAAVLERLFGAPCAQRAGFINPLTSLFHDVSFSHLQGRRRKLAYALAAVPVALGYGLHRPGLHGSESAYAWRRA